MIPVDTLALNSPSKNIDLFREASTDMGWFIIITYVFTCVGLPPTVTARELIFGDPDDNVLKNKIIEYVAAFRTFVQKNPIEPTVYMLKFISI